MNPKFPENNFYKCVEPSAKGEFPRTDYYYQAATLPNFRGGCARPKLPSFHNISGEYFRNEAGGEFRWELIAFVAIFITAAIPVLSNLHAMADFLHAIGTL
ncbi:MAG: hypothetical protein QOH24_402 [Verrucomicrobiota bacterium]|jgi:hypothetical protein